MAIQRHSFVRSGDSPPAPRPFAQGPDGQVDVRRTVDPQSPPTPWEVLGLPLRLDLDLPAVELRVRGLIRALHPDRFHVLGAQAAADAERHTALVNDAWRTLREPERRVAWLVDHQGQTVTALPPAVALQLFERNEQIDEALADPVSHADVAVALRAEIRAERMQVHADLAVACARHDAAVQAADPAATQGALAEMGRLLAMAPALDNLLARLG
ncbi:MAG: hypothetical protein FJ100_13415 [Deltaproteobacteria bacterium]|nr:hypothetical protein [Deltaproteobacteria bacterium]